MEKFKGGFSYDLSVPGQVDLYDFPPQPVSPLPVKKMELDELRYDPPKRPSSPPAGAVDRDVGDTGFLALLYQFGDTVSAAGLPRVFTERSSLWSRLIYAIVFVASFGTGVYFSVKIVQEFLEYPVIVTTAFTAESRMDFPSVTICNTNRVRYSAIIESKHSDLEYLLTDRSLGGLYYPPCLEDDMLCDTNECLRRFKVCDGIRDCDGGEDEVNCYYGNKPSFQAMR
ncbi:degenerin-like protein asic-2 [Ptychodera flava]|uniref:degenerin-like protein asic-2 n=1 Tax=Ptychodera flava TaxID=63121 RepID=UPI00396A03F7